MTDQDYAHAAQRDLAEAALWLVENGITLFKQKGQEALTRHLLDRWHVQLWTRPRIDDGRYLALFRIKARGINYDIHNAYRTIIDREIYEFWVFKVAADDWSGAVSRSEFLLARTSDVAGFRIIERRMSEFTSRIPLEAGGILGLPLDDLRLLYDLQSWHFPDQYRTAGLDQTKVTLEAPGQYRLTKP